ncbi:MAG: alpha/beta fold hydrolase [Polyangiales bacterium]
MLGTQEAEMPKLEVRTSGQGRPLVVLHGSPQDPRDLDEMCTFLALHAEVHRVAMPGYGHSVQDFDWNQANDLLRLYVDALERPVLLGVSGGAYRALALAANGASLSGVLSIGGFAHLEAEMAEGLNQAASALEQGVDLTDTLVGLWFSPTYAKKNAEKCRRVVAAYLKAASAEVIAADVRSLTGAPDLRSKLRNIDVPIRILVGELDAATPMILSEAIRDAAPESELEVVWEAGHLVLHEARERVFAWSGGALATL